MSTLCIMTGVAGSGKSTTIRKYKEQLNGIVISRDAIRFSKVKSDEPYFSKEKEVYKEYINQINKALKNNSYDIVFADATQLTKNSRSRVLSLTRGNATRIICIYMDTSLNECLDRNEKRKMTRAYVPRGQIRRMYIQLEEPTIDEGFDAIYRF